MLQEIFRIPFFDIPVYGYGLMLVVGFLCSVELAKFLARRSAIDPEVFATAALLMLISGVAGARLSHILENLGEFTRADRSVWQNVKNMADIRSGGLTYYGGFLLATACAIAYARAKKVPLFRGMDIVAPCLMVGLAFGRIGCFLNGCCYGTECNLPWGVEFPYYSNAYVQQWDDQTLRQPVPPSLLSTTYAPGVPERLLEPSVIAGDPVLKSDAVTAHSNEVHPTQIYSAITAFMLAALLIAFYTLPHPAGRVFALMLMLEGGTRFLLEMIRVEPAVLGSGGKAHVLTFLPPISLSMIIGLGLVISGFIMWVLVKGPDDDLSYHSTDVDLSTPAAA